MHTLSVDGVRNHGILLSRELEAKRRRESDTRPLGGDIGRYGTRDNDTSHEGEVCLRANGTKSRDAMDLAMLVGDKIYVAVEIITTKLIELSCQTQDHAIAELLMMNLEEDR